ncbi:MAG TPA: hypothetical protein VIR58_09950 [Acidimicrobiales bacterium]
MLTAADDRLHPPVDDDPWWTETAWFGFAAPAEGLCGSIYQIYRTTQGVMATAVYVWAPGREDLRELPYYRTFWHLPIPDGAQPLDNELPSGLTISTEEALRTYRLRYDDPAELTFDLRFEGIHEAQPFHVSNGMGHLDQLGRVTGQLVLHGRTIPIDCIEMRDRSWTPRRETSSRTRRGYTYGADGDGRGFYVATSVAPGSEDGTDEVIGGYLLQDGEVVPVTGGERRVARDDQHRPSGVVLEMATANGMTAVSGAVESRLALPTTPYFAWMSLVEWTADDGWSCWGEDHDSWSPRRWRAFTQRGGAA